MPESRAGLKVLFAASVYDRTPPLTESRFAGNYFIAFSHATLILCNSI
jgi:hypothetical protein